jgi:hypothetical protein
MYYDEKVIDGILHLRSIPNGEWEPMSQEQLTALVLTLRQQLLINTQLYKNSYENFPIWKFPFDVTCK